MFVTLHLSLSVILGLVAIKTGYIDFDYFPLILIGGILPDLDILTGPLHRDYMSHTPIFWVDLMILGIVYYPLLIISCFALIHILIDGIDWGVMYLYPYNKKKYGLMSLKYEPYVDKQITDFLGKYWSNKHLVTLEIIAGVVTIISFLSIFI